MNQSLARSTKQLTAILKKNSPTALTVLGVAGVIGAVTSAIMATTKAMDAIKQETEFREKEQGITKPLDPVDILKVTWRFYLPTVGLTATTIACMIGSNSIHLRRNAALASLLTVAETGFAEYKSKVVEQFGEKKEEKLRGEVAQQHLDQNPPSEKTIVLTGNGDYLCFDTFSGQYFRSTKENIEKAAIRFNQQLLVEGWLGINEFFYELGLESMMLGDERGWIAEKNILELQYLSKVSTREGKTEPCLVIDYAVRPYQI